MAPERDADLPPIQATRRTAVVRGLRPRLWSRRVLPPVPPQARQGTPGDEPPPVPVDGPLTYDDQGHLHGGPQRRTRMDLED